MSGNLRSRRRPPYRTYICAAISSILLMLSVSILYSTISHSHPHFHTKILHRNSRSLNDSINYDSLLSDSADDIFGTEDKIDVLDAIDEQQDDEDLKNFELEEEDEPFEQIKVSGHFFDHVTGVIRRAYDKPSIEAWEDTQSAGLFMGSGVEDRSKAAFGSDDVPVDDLVRKKAIQVTGIEDALLLKIGKRVSPLREGWGDWFDKKADFLRRDKMLKSNFEGLKPIHNPILQDPDGVSVTVLTKSDRNFQKTLIEDFKKVPFSYLGPKETPESSKWQRNWAKAKERDTRAGGKMFPVDDSDVGKCNPKTDGKAYH